MLIHGFSPVNARLLTVYGTAFYAIIRVNCNQKLLQNHITSTSIDVKEREGDENVKHRNMYRDCALFFPSVYLDIVVMGDKSFS